MAKVEFDPGELEALLPIFVGESEQHLARLEEALIAFEQGTHQQDDLSTALRAMHTLKGSASMLGLDAVSEVAHVGEDVFEALREDAVQLDDQVVSLLLRATDAIATMVAAVNRRELPEPGGHEALIAELQAITGRTGPAEGDAPVSPGELGEEQVVVGPSIETAPPAPSAGRTLRVDVEKLDRLVDLVYELALERRTLPTRVRSLDQAQRVALRDALEESDHLVDDLRETMLALRLVPLGPMLKRFARPVRDIAAATGKRAQLVVEGEDVEADTAVAEGLLEPLTHLVRNAMDHGIESGPERAARGKKPTGTITIRARREASTILVEVEDDGGGLSLERLRARAHEWDHPGADELTEAGLQDLVFEPGFSTAQEVSDLSGRGVGMDIVRRKVESVRGSVALSSREGHGTVVSIRVPLTVGTVEGLLIEVGEGIYVLPLANVVECGDAPPGARDDEGVTELRGEALPYVRLRSVFGDPSETPEREQLLVVRHGNTSAGLLVDGLGGTVETMIRPIDARLRSPMAGSTVLEDGRIGLILDVPALLQGIGVAHAREAARVASV